MKTALLVALGGAVGTLGRYAAGLVVAAVGGPIWAGTLAVNLLGAFAMGMVAGSGTAGSARVFLATGVLGGFTTFSALTLDTSVLGAESGAGRAVLYAGGTVVLGMAAFMLGRLAVRGGP